MRVTSPHTGGTESLRYTRERMMRRLVAPIFGAILFTACSSPPDKERHQAEGAIAAAREAGAEAYAPNELAIAETSLNKYEAAVAERDYRLALSLAVEARDTAYRAAKHAAAGKPRPGARPSNSKSMSRASSCWLAPDRQPRGRRQRCGPPWPRLTSRCKKRARPPSEETIKPPAPD